jgi:hypothetical protein
MAVWYPEAMVNKAVKSGGSFIDGVPFRGVLHTTEGRSFSPRKDSYGGWHTAYPHFTLIQTDTGVAIFQHLPIDVAARALKNKRGGVQTNRARTIQIEIVGKAAESSDFSEQMLTAISSWMRWVEAETGVLPIAPLEFIGWEGAGEAAKSRMSSNEWMAFNGWCGHQHVPENDHWDPGRINIGRLLMTAAATQSDVVDDGSDGPPPALEMRYRVVNVSSDDVLNVRAAAGTDAAVVSGLAADADGIELSSDRLTMGGADWVRVTVDGSHEGWVNSRFLAPHEGGSLFRVIDVAADDVLNVRLGAGVDHAVAAELPPDQRDIRRSGRAAIVAGAIWWEITMPTVGWVHSAYLQNQAKRVVVRSAGPETPQTDELDHGSVEAESVD